MTPEHVARWTHNHPLSPEHVDCAIAVMLKILDGKCKMKQEEKIVMALLYDQIKKRPAKLMNEEMHRLIDAARGDLTEDMKNLIYENRLLAETMISRPVMKAFKAMIRQQGLFAGTVDEVPS